MSKPPGTSIPPERVTFTPITASIEFSYNSTSKKPLPPLVQASFGENGLLQVSCVVFVANNSPNFKGVNYQPVISGDGQPQLDFFISYNATEEPSQTFNAHRVDFTLEGIPEDLSQIEVFLWDEDPITSRGTVTTVSI